MLAAQMVRAQLAAVVQHRPALGLRHRRSGPGPLVRRSPGPARPTLRPLRLRAAAAARLLHPERRRRPGERRRHHGPVGARGAPVQVRLGHRLQLLARCAARARGCSGGGKSSGLMSFLKIGDRAAGAIKSGGTTRRAAKMVIGRRRPSRHRGVHRLEGARGAEGRGPGRRLASSPDQHLQRGDEGLRRTATAPATTASTRARTRRCRRDIIAARRRRCPRTTSSASSSSRARATSDIEFPTYDTDWAVEAYLTVSGQNSNNSVRVTDDFLKRGRSRIGEWALTARTDRQGRQDREGPRAVGARSPRPPGPRADPRRAVRHHHQRLAHLPGVGADQRGSNPCSEYMFLDDTACNLASLNLMHFRQRATGTFDVEAFEHAVPPVDRRARDLGDDGAVPLAQIAAALLRVPHAGPGLRQPRRPADVVRPRLRQRPRAARICRRAHGADDRHRLRDLGRNGAGAGRLPGLTPPTASTCCG